MTASRRLLEISILIAETLAQVRQDQPDLWRPDRQMWNPSSLLFVTKVAHYIERYEPSMGINMTTESLLQGLLQSPFFTTEVHTQLITRIGQIWQPETPRILGAILLDADNQTLDVDKEQWIQEATETSISYRFAFANWKARNADIDLKRRGYYLIHAPAGDDVTDGLMIAFASTLPQHYSEVGRVFVCSNDRIFDALAATLTKYGVLCYRVIQLNRHRLCIHNYQAGTTHDYEPPLPTKQEFIEQVKSLAQDLEKGHKSWIPIIELQEKYQETYGLSIQKILQNYDQEHVSLTDVLHSLSGYFDVQTDQGQDYCRLTPVKEHLLPPPKPAAEEEMVDIIQELLRSQGISSGTYTNLNLIAAAYNTKYGHSISEGLRRRNLKNKLLEFISQRPSTFGTRKGRDGQWEVAYLAPNPPRSAEEMVGIILELLRSQGKAAGEYAKQGLITTAYNTKYGHGILEGLKRRGLVSNLRKFISEHPSTFVIRGGSSGSWEVAWK